MMQRGISLDSLACIRNGRELFSDLTLALCAGEALVVTGANGAGKSSLLRVLAGLLTPTAGRVTLSGHVALVDSRDALDRELTVAEAVGFWAKLDGGADVGAALAAMGIAQLAAVPVRMLSSGQRQRASLARIISSGVDIWLLDEPSTALDAAGAVQLEVACAAHQMRGGIVIAATHLPLALANARALRLGA